MVVLGLEHQKRLNTTILNQQKEEYMTKAELIKMLENTADDGEIYFDLRNGRNSLKLIQIDETPDQHFCTFCFDYDDDDDDDDDE